MPGGRPRIEFDEKDWKLLDVYCQFKHFEKDIASLMDCSIDTLERRINERFDCTFAVYRNKIMSKTKHNLFTKQYDVAMEGNPTMLIWLGKNYMNQTDKQEISAGQGSVKIEYCLDENQTLKSSS